jgi:mono/diheme cytochrome c family protein
MRVARVWIWAVASVGLVAMLASGWLVSDVTAAQQGAATASAEVRGNVEHGRYLVERVVMCAECHSTRDSAGNIVPGSRLLGGSMPVRVPWPGDWPLQIPRIAGLPGYTDAQAMRLLTEGAIKRNGTQARAPMPRFRMTAQDASDVIAYLRSL